MYALFLKEVRSFLSSLIGYISIGVFLVLLGLFLWVLPSDSTGGANIMDNAFANIDGLFIMAPFVYLVLIPAITMRSFSEEKKTGTLELLYTRPISDLQIVLAKYFAGLFLVFISLIPTLLYYYSVHQLGNPKGNIDTGGMWGSYIGLFMLGAGFVSIGIFASAISENQVISFILALLLCFVCYNGFDFIASSGWFGSKDWLVYKLGINNHYMSLSRGVVDTRDLIYFISLITVFVFLTRFVLERRKW